MQTVLIFCWKIMYIIMKNAPTQKISPGEGGGSKQGNFTTFTMCGLLPPSRSEQDNAHSLLALVLRLVDRSVNHNYFRTIYN